MVIETIKDPKKQVAQIQDQIQDQLNQVKDEIGQKLEIDSWLTSSKSDSKKIMDMLQKMSGDIEDLNQKVDKLSKKSRKKS